MILKVAIEPKVNIVIIQKYHLLKLSKFAKLSTLSNVIYKKKRTRDVMWQMWLPKLFGIQDSGAMASHGTLLFVTRTRHWILFQ